MKAEKYTPEQMIAALKRTKGMITVAAHDLHCSPQTVRNYIERYEDVRAALQDEREAMLDYCELALFKSIQAGERWAIALYLKTIGRSRGYVERSEVTGKDGTTLAAPIIYIPREDDADEYDAHAVTPLLQAGTDDDDPDDEGD
jgi:hypothetical protein